jgi:DNA-binding transcriptional regulator LsrR (DeoR family)
MPLSDVDPREARLCARVAKLYYEGELTQQEIGERVGLSRIKVHRILNRAREMGIVEIRVHTPENNQFINQEHELVIRFGLRDALIVPAPGAESDLYSTLAQGAAEWLEARLAPGIRIGLGLGRTISHLPRFFTVSQKTDCTFTEVVGGSSEHSGGIAKYNVTSKMAELAGGRAELLYAPNLVSSAELQARLVSEPAVADALERARQCDMILQSVGTVDDTAILYIENRITKAELDSLRQTGAIGDALGHYFDDEGQPVSTFLDNRVIGLDLVDLKKTPWSVVVAGGEEKHAVIRAALKGGYFNVLITDSRTAADLLNKATQKEAE